MSIEIITTGGTIDKIYFDEKSSYEIGEPQIGDVLRDANLTIKYWIKPLLRKDSLDLTTEDRELIRSMVLESSAEKIVITHGTDTLVENAALSAYMMLPKTLVWTGSWAGPP